MAGAGFLDSRVDLLFFFTVLVLFTFLPPLIFLDVFPFLDVLLRVLVLPFADAAVFESTVFRIGCSATGPLRIGVSLLRILSTGVTGGAARAAALRPVSAFSFAASSLAGTVVAVLAAPIRG